MSPELPPHSHWVAHHESKDKVEDWSLSVRGERQGKSFTLFINFAWECNLLLDAGRWSQAPADNIITLDLADAHSVLQAIIKCISMFFTYTTSASGLFKSE